MRKIYLFCFTFLFLWQVKAQFPEGFESGFPPAGWATFRGTNDLGTAQDWESTTDAANGTSAAFVRWEFISNAGPLEDWLVTPQFTPTASANIIIFNQKQGFTADFGTTYTVRVSTSSQTNHADFVVVDTQTENDFGLSYESKAVDLSAYNGQAIYLAFVMEQNNGDNWFVDDVDLIQAQTAPNCAENPMPTDNQVDVVLNIDNSVTLSWNPPATGDAPNSYEIFFGTTSGNLTSVGSTVSTTANVTNINFNTEYFWSVVPSNTGGSAMGCAEWSFTTSSPPPPPANDLPTGAIPLTLDIGSSCGANTITGISNALTTDSGEGTPSCGNYNGGDLWYTFVAQNTTVTLNTTNLNGLFSVSGAYYTGTPGFLVEEGCTQFTTGWPWELTGLTIGQTYYLRVWDFSNDEVGTFDLCGYYLACAAGEATAAIETTCDTGGTEFTVVVNFSNVADATAVSDGTNTYAISGSTATAGPYAFGTSVTLEVVHSDADCNFELGSYQVESCPPANDDCDGAIELTVNPDLSCAVVTNGTNVGSTPSPQPDTATGTPDNDVWFTFVATSTDHTIEISNKVAQVGTSTDMAMAVFDDAAGCNMIEANEVGESDPDTLNLSNLTIGNTYYVRVYGWFAATTLLAEVNFDICVGTTPPPPPPPANDDCANATTVSSLPFTSVADATSATNNGGFISECGFGMNDGVWYTYTPSQNEFVDINLTGVTGWDPEIAIYSGSCGSFTCVNSVDASGTGTGESLTGVELTAGTQYFINLGHWSGTNDGPEGPYNLDIMLNPTLNTLDLNSNGNALEIYPNPVSNVLNIKTSKNVKQVQLFSMQGKRMNAIGINANNKEIAVSQLESGMYLVQIELEDGSIEVRKFIKK